MPTIEQHSHWRFLVLRAEKAKLKSQNPVAVQQFVDDQVDGPVELKAQVLGKLLRYLHDEEIRRTGGKIIVPLGSNDADSKQKRRQPRDVIRLPGRAQEGQGREEEGSEQGEGPGAD